MQSNIFPLKLRFYAGNMFFSIKKYSKLDQLGKTEPHIGQRAHHLQLVPLIIRLFGVHHVGQPLSNLLILQKGNKQNHLPSLSHFTRHSYPYLMLPLKPGRGYPECAPAVHTTRSCPRAAAAAVAEIRKRKKASWETEFSIQRNPPKNAPSLRLPPLPFRGWWERSQGGRESFLPSTCTPLFHIPQSFPET